MRYTDNLIDKVKLRIKEKLINSFILRIEREKNAEEHLRRLYKGDFQKLNSSDYYLTDIIQNELLKSNDYLEYFGNFSQKIIVENNNNNNNYNNKKNNFSTTSSKILAVDFNNSLRFNISNRMKENTTNSLLKKKSKRLIKLLNSLKSSKKFIDFTSVFLDSDEEFQSKFNERGILEYIKKLDDMKKPNKQDNKPNNSNHSIEANSTNANGNAKKKKGKLYSFDDLAYKKENESTQNDIKINFLPTTEEEANAAEKAFEKTRQSKESLSAEIKNLNLIKVNYDIPESKIKRRKIKFFIDLENDCDIYVNDTVYYENNKDLNVIDHLILHNDVENIDPRSINSETREVNYFIFNRRLNMFSVNINSQLESSNDSEASADSDFDINYEYMANNLIKSSQFISKDEVNSTVNFTKNTNKTDSEDFKSLNNSTTSDSSNTTDNLDKDEESFWNNFQNSYLFDNNITSYLFGNLKKTKNKKLLEQNLKKFNEFIWRVNNENSDQNIYIELEFLFALGNNFDYNKIKFNFQTTRSSNTIYDKEFQIFSWKGVLLPYEVKNIKCAFPLAFESCGNRIYYDFSILMLLSLFIVIIVVIIYLFSKFMI